MEATMEMKRDWLSKDLWRAHVSWLSPPWVGATEEARKAYDAKRWMDQLQSAHYDVLIFYVKHHDGFCAYPSKYSKIQPERDFLGECVAEARKRDMRVQAYYSSVLDQVTGGEHPHWQVLGREGETARGWFAHCWPGSCLCINNPGYREMMLGQIQELLVGYQPDGLWLDVFSPHTGENCFCPHCQEKYAQETGNRLLDTSGELWYESCFAELMREIRDTTKRSNRPCVLGYNSGIRIPEVDRLCDFYTHEAVDAATISLMCRCLRSCDKPYETTYRLYTAVGSYAMRGPDRILLESAATLAHGGACSIEVAPSTTGELLEEAIARVAEVGEHVRSIEQYLVDTQPVYDAALFQREGQYGWPRPDGWHTVMLERQIPFAILYPDADLTPYRLLVLDGAIDLDEELAGRVARYVEEGGSLIVEGSAAQFDSPAGKILSEVLGIRYVGKTGNPAQYLSALDERIASDIGEDDLIVEGEAFNVKMTTATPLAYYRYEFADRGIARNVLINLPPKRCRSDDVAITVNDHGKGRAMYVACPLATAEIRNHRRRWEDAREYPLQLAANLARFMIGEPLLKATAPAGVEVVVNSQEGRHLIHLLNHYVSGQYYDNRRGLLKLAEVSVRINEKRIGSVKRAFQVLGAERAELPLQHEGEWVEVTVPKLGPHGIIVLEH